MRYIISDYGGSMNICKKSLSCFLSGILCVTASVSPTANAVNSDIDIDIIEQKGGLQTLHTSCLTSYNSSLSSADGYKAVYDAYVKVDSEGFALKQPPGLAEIHDEQVTSVRAFIDNKDGSFIEADIIDFEPAQMDHFYIAYPTNDDYTLNIMATTDINVWHTYTITDARLPYNSADKTPPNLTVKIPQITEYNPNAGLLIDIYSDELCYMKLSNYDFKMSNHATCTVRSDGKYSISAVDLNGNSTKVSFTVDVIGKLTTTTKTTTKTTTTTTTTTAATAPQAKPVYGDANCDSVISIADAACIFQYLANPDKYNLTDEGLMNADCANPGSGITANDAIVIIQYDAGLISSFT